MHESPDNIRLSGSLFSFAENSNGKEVISMAEFHALKQELLEKQRLMEERMWIDSNLSRFDELIRINYDKSIEDFSNVVLEYFAEMTSAVHGAFFVVDSEKEVIRAVGGYACTPETMHKSIFTFGEGMIGQAVKSQRLISLDNVPTQMTSSLMHLGTAHLIISPFLFNQVAYGALEIITLQKLPERYVELIKRCSQSLATSLQSVINNQRTKQLLEASLQKTEELQAQSEELRQNMEELEATQEEMERKELEMSGIVQAINNTLARIEFDTKGRILAANEQISQLLGYTPDELIGLHHSVLLEKEYATSKEYEAFWEQLRRGVAQSDAEIHRIAKNGDNVWMSASYTPIIGPDGKPYKVMKLGIDITERKRLAIGYQNQLEAIDKSFAVIEFEMDSTIITANQNFLAAMGYELHEIAGKPHRIFVSKQHSESNEYRALWDNLRKGLFQRGEFPRLRKDGRPIWIAASYNPIPDENGKFTKVVKYLLDITHLKLGTPV